LIGLLLTLASVAQTTVTTTTQKARKFYEKGMEYIASRQLDKAIESFSRAVAEDPEFVDAYIQLGDIEFFTEDIVNAEKHLTKAIDLLPNHESRPYWDLGHLYLVTQRFELAVQMFKGYLAFDEVRSRETAIRLLRQSEFAAEAVKRPVAFHPVNLGPAINTTNHEYLPSLTADEAKLIFTVRLGNNDEDFFVSSKRDDGWALAENIGRPISNPGFNEGAQSISPDGLTLYYAADYTDPQLPQNFNIYYTTWDGRGWAEPRSLPGRVNTRHYESQPSISADGKSLYFSSRSPGGYGGKDIWVSYLEDDGSWGVPENLGPTINTDGDEEVPFIHTDNATLYFGSNGHVGMGGSDLYYSNKQVDGSWGRPVNLGYPINTIENEGSLFISNDGRTGYFASDKPGGFGGYDLYSFEVPLVIRPKPVTYVRATVRNDRHEALDAQVELIDLTKQLPVTTSRTDAATGVFLVTLPLGGNYALNVSKPGYLFHSEHFSLVDWNPDSVFLIDMILERIREGEKTILRNVFFATDSYELLDESHAELTRVAELLEENPSLRVEIGGHTDNVGTAGYNQQLSEQRAKAVVDFLLTRGIAPDRLTFKGYGLTEPIDSNDSEAGRARNRRTEIKVVGYL
jgi:outer membrane protein OmpA-like peptidoglycan-associated protein